MYETEKSWELEYIQPVGVKYYASLKNLENLFVVEISLNELVIWWMWEAPCLDRCLVGHASAVGRILPRFWNPQDGR